MQDNQTNALSLVQRPRRNRKSPSIRKLFHETRLHPEMFVAPLFVVEGFGQRQVIPSMPEIYRFSIDQLVREAAALYELGVQAVDLFPAVANSYKDAMGSEAFRKGNLIHQATLAIKKEIPEMCVMVDIALDPYTDHGHDGVIDSYGRILNDATLNILSRMAVMAADAGADVMAPSDMMDGRVAFIRKALDESGHQEVSILAYAAKYASSFYGPFRDALSSAPKFGDKKTYQLNPANAKEAMREITLDIEEGADMLLIKPALAYLDIVAKAREITHLPLGAYHVSGEYSMVMAAAEKGWLDANKVLFECLLSIKRAGADFILTYAAHRMAELLNEGFEF